MDTNPTLKKSDVSIFSNSIKVILPSRANKEAGIAFRPEVLSCQNNAVMQVDKYSIMVSLSI